MVRWPASLGFAGVWWTSLPFAGSIRRYGQRALRPWGSPRSRGSRKLSTTTLRKYVAEGLQPGIRAASVAALRRLDQNQAEVSMGNGADDRRTTELENRVQLIEQRLEEMIQLIRLLERGLRDRSPGAGEEE